MKSNISKLALTILLLFNLTHGYCQESPLNIPEIHKSIFQEFDKYFKYAYFDNMKYFVFIDTITINEIATKTWYDNPNYYVKFTYSDCYPELQKRKNYFYHTINNDSVVIVIGSKNINNQTFKDKLLLSQLTNKNIKDFYSYSIQSKRAIDTNVVDIVCKKNNSFEVYIFKLGNHYYVESIDEQGSELIILNGIEKKLNNKNNN